MLRPSGKSVGKTEYKGEKPAQRPNWKMIFTSNALLSFLHPSSVEGPHAILWGKKMELLIIVWGVSAYKKTYFGPNVTTLLRGQLLHISADSYGLIFSKCKRPKGWTIWQMQPKPSLTYAFPWQIPHEGQQVIYTSDQRSYQVYEHEVM